MKRVILQEAALASSQPLDSAEESSTQKQELAGGNRRARTSAAMLGLALSMGASAVVMPRDGDSAVAADVKPNEPIVATLPETPAIALDDVTALTVAPPSLPTQQRHIVREGQTLWQIAQIYGVDVASLADANGMRDDALLQVGQTLTVVDAPAVAIAQPVTLGPKAYQPIALSRPSGMSSEDSANVRLGMGGTLAKMAEEDTQLQAEQEKSLATLQNRAQSLKDELLQARLRVTRSIESDPAKLAVQTEAALAEAVVASESVDVAVAPADELPQTPQAIDESVEIALAPTAPAVSSSVTSVESVDVSAELATVEQTTAGLAYGSEVQVAVNPRMDQAAPLTSVSSASTPRLPSVLPNLQPREPEAEPLVVAHANGDVAPINAEDERVALRNIDLTAPSVAVPGPESSAYRIQPGDTLNAIARQHGVSVQALAAANGIQNPNRIFAGTALTIPGQPASAPTAALPELRPTVEVATRSVGASAIQGNTLESGSSLGVPLRLELGRAVTDPFPGSPSSNSRSTGVEAISIDDSVQAFEDSLTARSSYRPGQLSEGALSIAPVNEAEANGAETELSIYAQQLLVEMREMRQQRAAATTAASVSEVTVEPPTDVLQVAAIARPSTASSFEPELTLPTAPTVVPEVEVERPTPAANQSVAVPQLIAAAPMGAESYAPINRPSAGQIVSPDLPPLPGSEEFLPGNAVSDGFVWPARGVLTSGYGWRWGRMHRGIDVAAPIGTPVVASAAGVVVSSGWNSGGYGNLVELRHADGTLTRYAHNNRLLVRPGQRVNQGQQIAEMGSTGYSTGPHVHFEIHPPNQGAVNPMAYLPGR